MPESKRVLFVCLGNICRSPAAEGIFKRFVEDIGRSKEFFIDSAGTAGYHIGHRADSRMLQTAARRGIDLTSRARLFSPRDLSDFDLVCVMDRENLRDVLAQSIAGVPSHVKLFSDFIDDPTFPDEVPDPYHEGLERFDYVLDMLAAGCENMLVWLDQHGRSAERVPQ
jgi:protein-tyrosine phosphatase